MDFITKEVAEQLGLKQEQIDGIKPLYDNDIAVKSKEWEGTANKNAEGILEGALKKVVETTKIPRLDGEKAAVYIERAGSLHLTNLKGELEQAKADYAQKLKDFDGDKATKAELDQAKKDLDDAKKTLADYDSVKDKAGKYDTLSTEYGTLKLEVAFGKVKPSFPDTVDEYRAKAKWGEFQKEVLEKYNIEMVDGEPMAIDKENQYKQVKLSSLVKDSKEISELMEGRKQTGLGAKQAGAFKIEGVDFEVTELAKTDSKERSRIIKDALTKEGLNPASGEYSQKFAKLNKLILDAVSKK